MDIIWLHERDCDSDPLQRGASPKWTAHRSLVCERRINCAVLEWRINAEVADVLPKSDIEGDRRSGLGAGDGDPPGKVQTECFHGDPAGKWSPSDLITVQRLCWTPYMCLGWHCKTITVHVVERSYISLLKLNFKFFLSRPTINDKHSVFYQGQ